MSDYKNARKNGAFPEFLSLAINPSFSGLRPHGIYSRNTNTSKL